MKNNAIHRVAKNHNVSEKEVRAEITKALLATGGFNKEQAIDVDAVINLLADKIKATLEKN